MIYRVLFTVNGLRAAVENVSRGEAHWWAFVSPMAAYANEIQRRTETGWTTV